MAYYRKLPSGLWQATVRGPDGRRHTTTDKLKSVARTWATAEEARFRQGDVRDPRSGDIRVGDWHARYSAASGAEAITRSKHASLWETHCEPRWAGWRMSAVTRMEAQGWVGELRATRLARYQGRQVPVPGDGVPYLSSATVHAIVHVMSSLYRAALREHPPVVLANPFADLDLPAIEPRPVEFWEPEEAAALYEALGAFAPKWRTLAELGMDVGLRPGEIFGLHGHRVGWLRGQLEVADVMTRQGLREYPKSRKSNRVVPVPAHVMEGMAAAMAGRPQRGLVFAAADGAPLNDRNFLDRVWYPAVAAAGIRRFPMRIMRHTAASWLVQDGVPLYDVQALLGHEDYATTQRYAHLAPGAHGKVTESWERRRASGVRQSAP